MLLEDAPPPLPEFPEHATYILVGAGTASFAAYRAIRKADNNAKVHVFMYYSPVCVFHYVQWPNYVLANVMELCCLIGLTSEC